jgi:two-component system cell cycle sensor histidine kinase/response regulator CckA
MMNSNHGTFSSADIRVLIDALPDALLVQSDNIIVFVNPALMKLVGAQKWEELIGQNIAMLIHPSFLAGIQEQIAIDHERGQPSARREFLLLRRDGSTIPVEAIGRSITWQERPAIEVVIRDITDRKRSEELLSDWEERLHLAEQAARMGVWEWNFRTEAITWSDEIYRQFGYTRETFGGETGDFLARIHPDDRSQVEEAIQATKLKGAAFHGQYRVVTPTGEMRWIDSHGVAKPNTTVMIGVAYDVTELKNAQARAEESEQNHRMLLNSTAEGIYGVDWDGICTFCNAAAARMLGYESAEQALGNELHSIHHQRRADGSPYPLADCKIYRAFREGRGTHSDDELFFRVDGSNFSCEYWSYPIFRDGSVVGSVVTFLDITERKSAEDRLRASEMQYRSIVENAPYGIFRSAPGGEVLMANPTLLRLLGYESEDELRKVDVAREVYRRPEQRGELVAKVLESGSIRDLEVPWRRKNGDRITVRITATEVQDAEGKLESFHGFIEDITERKILEKQFWHAHKMEAVGRLAGGIAHEFNNVLMVARSYADLILETGVKNKRVLRYAEQIQQATQTAGTVTRQLLAFSRKQILEEEELDLNGIISDLTKILPKIIGEDIEVVTSTNAIPRILADRGQAEQVLMNLAVNARDAMPDGGRFTIETGKIHVDARHPASMPPLTPGEYVVLSVSDSGTGMDAGTKNRIFEPFFTTKEWGKGTGFGLATVYGIVKQSNGFIWVDSEVGRGTTFRIYFPALAATSVLSKPNQTHGSQLPKGRETILIVEDDDQFRDAVTEYLSNLGYWVLSSGNGTEAVRMAETYTSAIAAVITDLVLPGINGSEVAKSVSSLYPHIRVIYMSGDSDRALKALGPSVVFLRKPFGLGELATKLRKLLDRNSH